MTSTANMHRIITLAFLLSFKLPMLVKDIIKS
jgi:hypothetical protein